MSSNYHGIGNRSVTIPDCNGKLPRFPYGFIILHEFLGNKHVVLRLDCVRDFLGRYGAIQAAFGVRMVRNRD